MAALSKSGHAVSIASRLRLHLREPDETRQAALAIAATHAVETLAGGMSAMPPDLWFTYHDYHKAPDLLGPGLSRRFGIPYVIAEASHAPRRAAAWTTWFAAAEGAIRAADAHVCLTKRDRSGIAPLLRPGVRLVDLPPFLDVRGFPAPPAEPPAAPPVRLVTLAMMRSGDKLNSYRFLAQALATIADEPWTLDVVGDGPVRAAVEAAFTSVPAGKITWHGMLPAADVHDRLAKSHLYVWPGFGEAFGLGYLEAQAMGLPVVALDVAGVSSVVRDGQTGALVADATPLAFAAAVAGLVHDEGRRRHLGRRAAAFVREDRTLDGAARVLDDLVRTLVA